MIFVEVIPGRGLLVSSVAPSYKGHRYLDTELADLVESMICRGLDGRQIWTELMDHHDCLITYGSFRHYIRYARSRTTPA
ncbi:hypothetical protein [Streptomyces sp. NPDC058092]|uniref:hypothetical protein n=1 Tax=Streptomyces sp. NPDC058092 TaxID=3346336 RepID=UPI0036E8ACE9